MEQKFKAGERIIAEINFSDGQIVAEAVVKEFLCCHAGMNYYLIQLDGPVGKGSQKVFRLPECNMIYSQADSYISDSVFGYLP